MTLALGVVLLLAAGPATARQPLPVSPAPRESILGAPAGYERPAADPFTTLDAQVRCSPTRPRASDVTLGWNVKRADVLAYRVDITEFRDGFETGRYTSSDERPAAARRFDFPDAHAGIHYYWRLLVRTPDGWAYAGNGRFQAPVCPHDESEEERGR